MAQYRGVEVPQHLCRVLPFMENVDECREALQTLGQQWDLLDVLSRVIETGTEVQQTRSEFQALNTDLVAALAEESLLEVISVLTSKAQVVVDVIIRNLFERTADIGFLATDEDLRAFLGGDSAYTADGIRERLLEYQAKYSVYENIIVLDTDGKIMASISNEGLPEKTRDPIIDTAQSTQDAYVETFAPSDLVPRETPCLTYAYRISPTGLASSSSLGVLVLIFEFEKEMDDIFRHLSHQDDWSILTLLNEDGEVLTSTDPIQIGLGAQLPVDSEKDYQIIRYAGRRYIAVTRQTNGYQGFFGLGWQGCALIPIEFAFEQPQETDSIALKDHEFRIIAGNEDLLSDSMREIPRRATEIQVELNRTVWNGHLLGGQSKSAEDQLGNSVAQQTLLHEISQTGERTSRIFGDAVSSLNRTAIGLIIQDCAFASALALNLMDRNLYERANDCRWWALTTQFRQQLAKPKHTESELSGLAQTLKYINDLYTVYTNLILFDRNGQILAVSNSEEAELVGTTIDPDLRGRITSRALTSYYGVSEFEKTPLYSDRPTYVYGAPVHDMNQKSKTIGGIAIVFDSEPELAAMLLDASPRNKDGELLTDSKTVYFDSQRKIISSTDKNDIIGSIFDIDEELLNIAKGEKRSTVITKDRELLALGISKSEGYREYKSVADDYKNTVYAACVLKLGDFEGEVGDVWNAALRPRFKHNAGDIKQSVELATFRIGSNWFGLKTANIVEAVTPNQVLPLPHSAPSVSGCIMYKGISVLLLNIRCKLSFESNPKPTARMTSIVLRMPDGNLLGLEVDELGDIVKINSDKLKDEHQATASSIANSIVPSDKFPGENQEGRSMMQVLDIPSILMAAGIASSINHAA